MTAAESLVRTDGQFRTRSLPLAILDSGMFVIFIGLSVGTHASLTELLFANLGLLSLLSAFADWRGIQIKARRLSAPYRPFPFFPILAVGTRSLLLDDIGELTSIGCWLGLQLALLDDAQKPRLIRFTSSDKRLHFFSVLKDAIAGLRIYRYGF